MSRLLLMTRRTLARSKPSHRLGDAVATRAQDDTDKPMWLQLDGETVELQYSSCAVFLS